MVPVKIILVELVEFFIFESILFLTSIQPIEKACCTQNAISENLAQTFQLYFQSIFHSGV